jgi:lipoprotein-anchoring transpeptidase ErfK/SrfK
MEDICLADLGYSGGQKIVPAIAPGTGKTAQGLTTSIEDRALQLLGSGISAEATANALGVTPSRISQLLSEQQFTDKVATLRYENLQKHNTRDGAYDSMEDVLLDKLEQAIPFMLKPGEILKALQVTNAAKRRGQSSPDQVVNQQNIVNLVLPEIIAQRFTVNIDNQVTRAGDQELHTMPASNLLKSVELANEIKQEQLSQLAAPLPEGELLEALYAPAGCR